MTQITVTSAFGLPAWQIESPTGAKAVIAERGATLVSWTPRAGQEVIGGYQSAADLAEQSRSLVMAPWAGRMQADSYTFQGITYQIPPEARLGLARMQDFTVTSAGTTLILKASIPAQDFYPWATQVKAHFSLDSGADAEEHLSVTLQVKNASKKQAPVALGWKPFVKFAGLDVISNLALKVPSRTRILTNQDVVPLPGESAYAGVNAPMSIEYLGSRKLSGYFRGLVPNNYGVVTTQVMDPASGSVIELTQEPAEAPVVHIDTGDSLDAPRSAIALAPMSHVPDAFNRPDAAGSVVLDPGETRGLTLTLTSRGRDSAAGM